MAIVLKDKVLEDDIKLERQENRADQITAWSKTNVKCKDYIGPICLGHIWQEFQAVRTDRLAHDLWECLKRRYTFQNIASKCATITSIDKLIYTMCKTMAEYCSKYYSLKTSVKEQSLNIEDALKIWMLDNLSRSLKTNLICVNNQT